MAQCNNEKIYLRKANKREPHKNNWIPRNLPFLNQHSTLTLTIINSNKNTTNTARFWDGRFLSFCFTATVGFANVINSYVFSQSPHRDQQKNIAIFFQICQAPECHGKPMKGHVKKARQTFPMGFFKVGGLPGKSNDFLCGKKWGEFPGSRCWIDDFLFENKVCICVCFFWHTCGCAMDLFFFFFYGVSLIS